jgi:uncharacterized protein YjbI with pentapeptide repeats
MTSSESPIEPVDPDISDDLANGDVPPDLVDHELESQLLQGHDLSARRAIGLRLTDCRLLDVDLTGSVLTRARMLDLILSGGSVANVRADDASVRRVRSERVRATGINLAASHLEDVTFIDCRIDLANFRFAQLERVRFEDCRLNEADFYEAKLSSTVFEDCDLSGVSWSGATFERSEMRGCDLAGSGGLERLRGVRMPWADVIRSANEIARAAGIEIIDR